MATVVGASTGSIDVRSTVDQLIEVELVKRIDPIDTKVTAKRASLTAVAALKTLSAALEDSLGTLADPAQFTTGTDAEKLTALSTAVASFVTNYNALNTAVVKYGTVDLSDPTRDTTAEVALYGDPALTSIKQVMRNGYSAGLSYQNSLSGKTDKTSYIAFSELGVSRKTDGSLVFSKTKLSKSIALDTTTLPQETDMSPALASSSYAQPKLLDRFVSGVSSTLSTTLASAGFGFVGTFDKRTAELNNDIYRLSNRRNTESTKIAAEKLRLLKTYSTLNSLLGSMATTNNFLTAQLAAMSKNN